MAPRSGETKGGPFARVGTPGRRPSWVVDALIAAGLFLAGDLPAADAPPPKPVLSMSLEELANLEVTTVSKRSELLLEAPAAVYVITQEEIRRSGVRSLVELLRRVPGVVVARVSSDRWAAGIRGFTSVFSRSVLVLVDGRSVYTPLFAGVYWEAQDTLLEDVERVEVIRGPGGSLWGANAVNGVVNIITKKAWETRGGLASAGGGTEDRATGAFRWGTGLGSRSAVRVYGKYTDRDAGYHADGSDFDRWHMAQAGFRSDHRLGAGRELTIQGDVYSSTNGERANLHSYSPPYVVPVEDETDVSGANALARFTRAGERSELRLQAYYDHTHRAETQFREDRDTVDVDVQTRYDLGQRHRLTLGAGFRWTVSDIDSVPTLVMTPARRTSRVHGGFAQDEIRMANDRLRLTLGAKLEHNDFTGLEVQPTVRLAFVTRGDRTVWAAVSRAVRTPSRVETDVAKSSGVSPTVPLFARLSGDPDFRSEKLVAWEAGYRARLAESTRLDVAVFYNDYDDLTSGEPAGAPFNEGTGASTRLIVPFVFANGLEGRGLGGEVAVDVFAASWLTLRARYAYLSLDLRPGPGSADGVSGPNAEGSSPRHRATLAAAVVLPGNLEADGFLRFVDRLPAQGVDRSVDLDVRFGWRPSPGLELSVSGEGLLAPRRLQWSGGESGNTEIQRAVYGKVSWRF